MYMGMHINVCVHMQTKICVCARAHVHAWITVWMYMATRIYACVCVHTPTKMCARNHMHARLRVLFWIRDFTF